MVDIVKTPVLLAVQGIPVSTWLFSGSAISSLRVWKIGNWGRGPFDIPRSLLHGLTIRPQGVRELPSIMTWCRIFGMPDQLFPSRRGFLGGIGSSFFAPFATAPLDTRIRGQTGVTWRFYVSRTLKPAAVYADAGLTREVGSTIKADVNGKFPEVFLNHAIAYRTELVDATGATVLNVDPYWPEHRFYVQTRAKLARAAGTEGFGVLLTELGREGLFIWDGSELSTEVAADTEQGIYVAPSSDTTGASGAWVRRFGGFISIRWFGAKFDVQEVAAIADATDDTAAWQAAIAFIEHLGGGTLQLPAGASKVTAELLVDFNKLRIVGTGKRDVYPGAFTVETNCPSTLVAVHADRNAFRFHSATVGDGSFQAKDFNVVTLETDSVPTAAFGWDCSGEFLRDFTFDGMGIFGFTSAFDVYKDSGANTQMGLFKAFNCNINRNTWIARTLNSTQWNGFTFKNNEAGQNGFLAGQGGLDVSAHAAAIEGNTLEGMRDAVRVSGAYRGVRITDNYFEANVGRACIELVSVIGPFFIGPNAYINLIDAAIHHKVLLSYTGLGACIDPYWPNNVHKMELPLLSNNGARDKLKTDVDSATYGYLRTDRLDGKNYSRLPEIMASVGARVTIGAREVNPQTGEVMPVQEYTTSGNGGVVLTYSFSGSVDEWVVMSWLLKRIPDGGATAHPYISCSVNAASGAGSRDYPVFNYATFWCDGEWTLITAAIKLGVAMTSIQYNLYPFGIGPAAGRVARFLRPFVYTVDDVNKIIPYVDNYLAQSASAAPAAGTWVAGDILKNSAPAAGSAFHVCTAAGTPGTWETS